MFIRLIVLFTVVPIIELAILIKAGNVIGLWPTISIVIGTGILGAALAKSQGTQIVTRIRRELAEGRMPKESLINAFLILAGGMVLLTPGFVTDLLGFSLLIPVTRKWFASELKSKLQKMRRENSPSETITMR